LPDIDHIPAEWTQAVYDTFHSGNHNLINSACNKEELPQQWKEHIIIPIDKTDCSN